MVQPDTHVSACAILLTKIQNPKIREVEDIPLIFESCQLLHRNVLKKGRQNLSMSLYQ